MKLEINTESWDNLSLQELIEKVQNYSPKDKIIYALVTFKTGSGSITAHGKKDDWTTLREDFLLAVTSAKLRTEKAEEMPCPLEGILNLIFHI